jgi:hypothetical protein
MKPYRHSPADFCRCGRQTALQVELRQGSERIFGNILDEAAGNRIK